MSRRIGKFLELLGLFVLAILLVIFSRSLWTWFWDWGIHTGIIRNSNLTDKEWLAVSGGWLKIGTMFCILLGGAAGGFIYSLIQIKGLQLPQTVESRVKLQDESSVIHKIIDLGWLGDVILGIGGGILIFLVLPYSGDGTVSSNVAKVIQDGNEIPYLLRVVATSMIGGFASRSIFDEASKTFKKKLEGLSDKVDEQKNEINSLGQDVTNIDKSVNNIDESNRLDSIVRLLLPRQLDPSIQALEGEDWTEPLCTESA
jgi:hypothetical protein